MSHEVLKRCEFLVVGPGLGLTGVYLKKDQNHLNRSVSVQLFGHECIHTFMKGIDKRERITRVHLKQTDCVCSEYTL